MAGADWLEHTLETNGDTYLSMPYNRCRVCHVMDYFIPELASVMLLALSYALAGFLVRVFAAVLALLGALLPRRRLHRAYQCVLNGSLIRSRTGAHSENGDSSKCTGPVATLLQGRSASQALCESATALLSSRPT